MDFKILIVDDEIEVCRSLCELLTSRGYTVLYETNPKKTLSLLNEHPVDLILMDLRMPEMGGMDLLREIRIYRPDVAVIVISGFATIETAVRAMKYGALNIYPKPIKIPLLLKEIEKIRKSFEQKNTIPQESSLIMKDPLMTHILSLVQTAAPTEAPVLITGESGTGKELIANTIHSLSKRETGPFLKINCASIPDTLLESEMFGYERGAFTDAKETKKGLFELAYGGTIFLDEIGNMSLQMQAKMLRVLQDGKFIRLGGTHFISANSRIIAATNLDLNEAIKTKTFREDLYYRLAVINIHVPPLRDRKQDILPLAEHFLLYFSSVYGKKIKDFSPSVKSILLQHSWPGNVRELKNFIERAVIFTQGEQIEMDVVPDQYRNLVENQEKDTLSKRIEDTARDIILEALSQTNGVKQDAARLLCIDRKTLYNRMKKLNLI
jgi:DNA-binding NtrC family response regulator